MKKITFFKTLLVAAGLLVGSSAWADETTTVGAADNSTAWWSAFSDYYTLTPNQTLTLNFKNYSDKAQKYDNWLAVVTTDADRGATGYTEYFVLRADENGWGSAWIQSNLSSNYNWDTFKDDMDGSDVVLTVTRLGANVKVHAVITPTSSTEYYEDFYTPCGDGTQNIRVFLTTEKGHLTDISSSIVANGATTETVGYGTLNADIDFSNAISDAAVAGTKNSMALSNTSGSNIFELGYTASDAATVLGDVLRVGKGTGTVTISDVELAGARDEVIITFDYYYGSLSGKNAGFYLYDSSENVIGGLYINKYDGSEVINSFGVDKSKITSLGSSTVGNAGICVNTNKSTFVIHLNYATGTMYLEQWTNGTLKQTTEAVPMNSTNSLKKFVVQSNYENEGRRCWFDNLRISTIKGDYSTSDAGYTVTFVDGDGNAIKADDTSREAAPGTPVSALATSDDQTTFYNDGDIANNNAAEFVGATNKYVYKSVSAVTSSSDDTPITELVDGAIITVVYDKYNKYDYTVSQKLGDNTPTSVKTGTLWGDQTETYYYPICVKSGEDYYVTEANASTPKFGITIAVTNAIPTINYTLDESIVYYAEAENMGGSRYNYAQSPSNSSNGSSWCSAASSNSYQKTNWSLSSDGYYNIEVGMANRNYAVNPEPQLMTSTDDASPIVLGSISLSSSSYTTKTYSNQLITAGQELYIYNDNGGNASKWALDYVILRKIENVSVTVTSAGWATLYTSVPLDFSGTGLTAYTATTDGSTVTLTEVNDVPANTGVVLNGAEGSYGIPVIASSETPKGGLIGSATEATAYDAEAGYTYYVLTKDGSTVQFNPVASGSIAAGKAFLKVASGGGANLRVVIDDEATVISGINVAKAESDVIYNVAGQRVNSSYKGIVIKNGKKYLNK